MLTASNNNGSNSITYTNYILVNPSPPNPVIHQSHDTLFSTTDPSYTSYQWLDDTTNIPGGTGSYIVITHSGNYNQHVANAYGCGIAVGINVVLGINELTVDGLSANWRISPNPAIDELNIVLSKMETGKYSIALYNVLGERMLLSDQLLENGKTETFNIKSLSSGMYFIEITNQKSSWVGRFIKQ